MAFSGYSRLRAHTGADSARPVDSASRRHGLADLKADDFVRTAQSSAANAAISQAGDDWRDGLIDPSDMNATSGFRLVGFSEDSLGTSVSGLGDINGDGFDDVIVGSFGRSYVMFGGAGIPLSTRDTEIDGINGFAIIGAGSGHTVSAAGDVNGDGFADILVGTANANRDGRSGTGATYVVFGTDQGFDAELRLDQLDGTGGFAVLGVRGGDYSGLVVAGVGDVNGDGLDDFAVGAANATRDGLSECGEAYIVFGSAHGFEPSMILSQLDGQNGFAIRGMAAGAHLGHNVAAAGDVNDDGIADFLITRAPYGGTVTDGVAYVVFGDAGGFDAMFDLSSLDGTNGFEIHGVDSREDRRHTVDSIGDVNGDGIDDLVIGTASADPEGRNGAGSTYVVFGRTGFAAAIDLVEIDGTNGFVLHGENAGDLSGFSVSDAGDVNGDGIADLLIGSIGNSARSYVVFGSRDGFAPAVELGSLDGANGFVVANVSLDAAGWSVAAAGDVNADGYDDVVIGEHDFAWNYGDAYVIYGHTSNQTEGTSGLDELTGANGNDTINGYGRADRLQGLAGDDRLDGGSGDDVVAGGQGNDILLGRMGRDTIFGSGGDDIISGGPGRDTMSGSFGADRYVFESGDFGGFDGESADRITFFNGAEDDRIVLNRIDAVAGTAENEAFRFIGEAAFSGAAGELRFVQRAGAGFTMIQGDTNGDGRPDFAIRVDGLVDLAAADFVL